MSFKHHILGLAICTVLVAAFELLGLSWSFADFHPGSITDLPDYLHRRARLGSMMFLPFERPLRWLTGDTGGSSPLVAVVQWVVLPLCYGAIIYSAFVLLRKWVPRANRNT